MVGKGGWHQPGRSLTRIHGLDSDWRITADGEAKAILAPRDGDLGHSPAQLLPEAVPRSGSPQAPPQSHPPFQGNWSWKGGLASSSPSLSQPRHLQHWVGGQSRKPGSSGGKPQLMQGGDTQTFSEDEPRLPQPRLTYSLLPKGPRDLHATTLPVIHCLLCPFLLFPRGSWSIRPGVRNKADLVAALPENRGGKTGTHPLTTSSQGGQVLGFSGQPITRT